MLRKLLTFGLTREQEERFRQAQLKADLEQAKICIVLLILPIIAYVLNDYFFFGLSGWFFGITIWRLGLLGYTCLLLYFIRSINNFRSYDRAAFIWGLAIALTVVGIAGTRPQAYLGHIIVAMMAVFVFLLIIPNRFSYQMVISVVIILGEAAILWQHPQPQLQTAWVIGLTLLISPCIAILSSWQSHFWRRQAFVAGERERGTEEALRKNEEKYHKLVKYAPAAIYEMDLHGTKFLSVNEVMCDILGYSRDELLAIRPTELMNSEGQVRFKERIEKKLIGKTLEETVEYSIRRKDGGWIHAAISVGAVTYTDEEPSRVVVIGHDITERKRVEEALAKAQADTERRAQEAEEGKRTLDALLEFIPEGITIASAPDCVTLNTSRHGDVLLLGGWDNRNGVSAEEWLARVEFYLANGVTPAKPEDLPLVRAVKFGQTVEGQELILRRPDGSFLPVLCNAGPIRDKKGKITGGILAWRDIAERRKMEDTLRENDRRKDEFLAMLAHELRNPLGPIRTSVELLQSQASPGNPKIGQWTEIIRRQVIHLICIVNDLLDTSRISRGLVSLKKEPTRLHENLSQAIETIRSAIEAKQQDLQVDLSADPLVLDADPVRLVQILTNLVSNAVKFTPPKGSVRIRTRQEVGQAVIEVEDTGAGIPADILPLVFEIFFQADKSLARTQGGLGLGLTLVRQLTQLHGGTIEAQSAGLNQGSRFILRLPLLSTPENGSSVALASAFQANRNLSEISQPGLKVLVVEDNFDSAESLGDVLKVWGYEVFLAYDGLQAVERALSVLPDVALLDIGLPGLDGYAVADRFKSEPSLAKTTLVALTGYNPNQQRMAESGFKGHFTKPVDLNKLEKYLTELAYAGGT